MIFSKNLDYAGVVPLVEELSSLQRVIITCTEYLKDSMPRHQNIFQGSIHVPDASKDKAPE